MAHHASAKKRIRQTARRTQVNRTRLSAVRTSIRKVEMAIAGGDAAAAQEAFKAAQPLVMRGAQKGILHANMASRKLSRLVKQIKGLSA
ncbi:MAG: 30S ribosomal protein S20 [Alphaproteobacteria bacterium]|nr:30S ribosomal protein S20 [Magnetovibrio sp.]UTW51831.1 30S ribosomal protein S20 [bacterium SCSIO 12827]HCS69312.1 30S ribosomal protein S20 [Rhodospirillaceae bacterium]|tara:strand:- start:235 stop:501 length:267 start_codon:yes stop_codon:yes gene_type:complete